MARENGEQALREYGSRKKRYIKRRNLMISIVLIAIAVMGVAYLVLVYNRSYHNYKTVKSADITGEDSSGYLSYEGSVIKYGKDGAQAYDKDGRILWNVSYNMSDPITDTCGKYVVIADRGSKSVQVLDAKGAAGNYQATYNIVKVQISSQGVVAALMQEGDNNYIMMYDLDGTELTKVKNTVNNAGYPMDIALSDDAMKLVTIYLSVSTGDVTSNVVCTNFDEVGKNYYNKCVGAYHFKKGIVAPRVKFLSNDTFSVYKDNGFVLYSMKEKPQVIKENNLKGKIQSIFYNKKYTGVVLESEDASSKHLILYDFKGKKVLDKALDYTYKSIFMTTDEIIMYDDQSCAVMRLNGRIKFKYVFKNNISALCPINGIDRYFLINETKLAIIRLT